MIETAKVLVENAWQNRELLQQEMTKELIRELIDLLDKGKLRVAEKINNEWKVNEWIKTIILYFIIQETKVIECSPFEFNDKIALKRITKTRHSCCSSCDCTLRFLLERDVILMPSYVNIGAYIGKGSLIDTWATVGSCAQIGENVHISGGVGIGEFRTGTSSSGNY